ncbi:methyl-accepting chemotaxis protein [Sporosarcina luteola]|uniref:methyl-accepting chemotaxis protein n=1 Tax=Sporosarcina luteola TaxID=582850 RepID=UPI00203A82E9|nr:methyl-accepting chemotaxis protein [Sporosarcina luteola]MCM3744340.1 methyl-accepting chemotaxis protein [Sporosarcina luteola]
MKKQKSIVWKLSGLIIGLFLLLFIAYTVITSTILHKETVAEAENYAIESTRYNAQVISARFGKTDEMLHTTKRVFETLHAQGNLTTEEILSVMERNLTDNADAIGMAAVFESGAIPLDDQVNKNVIDSSGKLIPYLYKDGNRIDLRGLVGYDVAGDGDWYAIPKKEKRAVLTEPHEYDAGDKMVLMTTMAVPLETESGQLLGVLAADLTIDFLNDLVTTIQPDGGYASIITETGNLTANSLKADMIGTNMQDSIDWSAVKKQLDEGQTGTLYVDSKSLKEKSFNTFAPIMLDNIDDVWSVQTVLPRSTILGTFNKILLVTVISAIIIVVIMAGATSLFIFRQLKPLSYLQRSIEAAATGDITQSVDEKYIRNDEIGAVTNAFNDMLRQTNEAMSAVRSSSNELSESSSHVHHAFEEIVASSEEVALATNEIAQGASTQSEDTEETSSRMTELAEQITTLSSLADSMDVLSKQTVASTEKGIMEVQSLREHNETANEMNTRVQRQMDALSTKIAAIDQVIASIQSITGQTNLLALNASIEAARAGEHGKGFAVVAEEVRKLAEQSRVETEVIQQTVQEIITESKQTSAVIESNLKLMEGQNKSVTGTESSFMENAELTEQMSASIKELTAELSEMLAHKDQVMTSIQSVSAVSEETAASAEQVSASSIAQQNELERVADSTTQMKDIANELRAIVERFKLQ